MATFVFKDAYISIDSNDLSADSVSVTLDLSADAPEDTAMGDTFTSLVGGGIKTASITVEFNQDFAASGLDSIIYPLFNTGTAVAFEVRPTSDAVSTSNPKFTGSVLVTSYQPLGGSVGDKATASVTLPITGTVTRATS
jgi:hypothetical protein